MRIAFGLFLGLGLVMSLRHGGLAKNVGMFRQLTLSVMAQAFVVVAVVIAAFTGLMAFAPFTEWSWFRLFDASSSGVNVAIVPIGIKYFGIAFAVLLMLNLPTLALSEEEQFRRGTVGWWMGARRSLWFGVVHCFFGVPIAAGLAIGIAGLWFTRQYFIGGVKRSTLHHTAYNVWLVGLLLLVAVMRSFARGAQL